MDPKETLKWLKNFFAACAWSLIAINLGLRKGEAARASALHPESPWAPAIEMWFELAAASKPVADDVLPAVTAALTAALIEAAKSTIQGFFKGLKK